MSGSIDLFDRLASYPPAPSDEECGEAWDRIMAIAREHCLIVGGCGGTATLAMPGPQRDAEVRAKVLAMHCRREVEP